MLSSVLQMTLGICTYWYGQEIIQTSFDKQKMVSIPTLGSNQVKIKKKKELIFYANVEGF